MFQTISYCLVTLATINITGTFDWWSAI